MPLLLSCSPDIPLQYGFIGYGSRRHAKLTWPLLMITMQLLPSADSYVRNSLRLRLKRQYMHDWENVSIQSFLPSLGVDLSC